MLVPMTAGVLPLPASHLSKAQFHVRGLRRALIDYWYATLEDAEAAALEATRATFAINILDEAVFEDAFGDRYRTRRAKSRLGRVVMGLELIRNCETHASVAYPDLLVLAGMFGVPSFRVGNLMRSVFRWAEYADLPSGYRDVGASATPNQRRARGEAQDGYRFAVQGRLVTETIFDALAFFQALDERLLGPSAPALRWAYGESHAELPDTDPRFEEPTAWHLARPMGLDRFEPFLPDIACRYFERRTAQWPAADDTLKQRVKAAKKGLPATAAREVTSVISADGTVVGFGGYTTGTDSWRGSWVERRMQVWHDVRRGFRYFVLHEGTQVDLGCQGHQEVGATDGAGRDLLNTLPVDVEGLDAARLKMVDEYPDLYLEMRTDV